VASFVSGGDVEVDAGGTGWVGLTGWGAEAAEESTTGRSIVLTREFGAWRFGSGSTVDDEVSGLGRFKARSRSRARNLLSASFGVLFGEVNIAALSIFGKLGVEGWRTDGPGAVCERTSVAGGGVLDEGAPLTNNKFCVEYWGAKGPGVV
jgi:hypothetical protein